jgi:hypothetical protein
LKADPSSLPLIIAVVHAGEPNGEVSKRGNGQVRQAGLREESSEDNDPDEEVI